MIQVGLLTIEQKDKLIGEKFNEDSSFFPIEDKNGNWVISLQEMEQCTNLDFNWIKNLPIITYEVKEIILPIE